MAIVDTAGPVTLLGAGEAAPETLNLALRFAPILVAADGAARRALDWGRMPDAVIGDFDSLDPADRARIPGDRLHPIPEQDSTDFDKCLRSIRAPLVLAVGFAGARLDHQLAALTGLLAPQAPPCILLGPVDLCFAAPPRLRLELPPGLRLSLYPLAPVTGRSRGLHWPIEGLAFAPWDRIGTSNRVTGPVELAFDAPGMLVILPAQALEPAMAGLRAATPPAAPPAPSPARGG